MFNNPEIILDSDKQFAELKATLDKVNRLLDHQNDQIEKLETLVKDLATKAYGCPEGSCFDPESEMCVVDTCQNLHKCTLCGAEVSNHSLVTSRCCNAPIDIYK